MKHVARTEIPLVGVAGGNRARMGPSERDVDLHAGTGACCTVKFQSGLSQFRRAEMRHVVGDGGGAAVGADLPRESHDVLAFHVLAFHRSDVIVEDSAQHLRLGSSDLSHALSRVAFDRVPEGALGRLGFG